ncbi:MAG: 1-deoxy-D-xylulose-5-phosphate synthase [Solirubrobacteraceae bacterium]
MQTILQKINSTKDLKKLSLNQLPILANEIREFILDILSIKEGHLGASLGVVELTIALHYYYNTPDDKLIWDVGHQAYAHKILTGRKHLFSNLRELNGISGFPSIFESEYDAFGTGHSSTSISAIIGMAKAAQLSNKKNKHIAVIGDASIASGMAFEALNHLGDTNLDVLIILNDNSIGIDPSIGALKNHLIALSNYNEGLNLFENLNLHYTLVEDGHNLEEIILAFKELENISGPKLLHLKTIKGKGYENAEKDQITWHAPGKFNKKSGELEKKNKEFLKYSDVFGETMLELATINAKVISITPAMPTGSNLQLMSRIFPERVIDVGIAEQHAVTFSAGLAKEGFIPYCVVYSTFLQRAYDQIIHDVAIQNLPVIFCVDRAGIVGNDGATHHGYFDISFLTSIPNLIVAAPKDGLQLRNLLYTAQLNLTGPFAIRYPRGETNLKTLTAIDFRELSIGKGIEEVKGEKIAILYLGDIGNQIHEVYKKLNLPSIGIYNMLFAKPLDENLLDVILQHYSVVLTFEQGILNGGFGARVLTYANKRKYAGKIESFGYPDNFITHGSTKDLNNSIGLSNEHIKEIILNNL